MAFLDFDAIKQSAPIEAVAKTLGLELKQSNVQFRGPCPACKSGGDRALCITPAKAAFFCFGAKMGGDVIQLVAHILGLKPKEAAQWLQDRFLTVPESATAKETQKLQPLSYLEHDHPAVEAVGFDPDIAKAIGIGYASKGMMRGLVAVPIRDEHGTLLAYIGVTEAKLPPSLMGQNVIELETKRA